MDGANKIIRTEEACEVWEELKYFIRNTDVARRLALVKIKLQNEGKKIKFDASNCWVNSPRKKKMAKEGFFVNSFMYFLLNSGLFFNVRFSARCFGS
ncbi:hypothetical protein SUGI_1055870 [Cryptomeria japonica]|nr:hypothetical protein SUGI_1055870 [Cryptomeria japonica]